MDESGTYDNWTAANWLGAVQSQTGSGSARSSSFAESGSYDVWTATGLRYQRDDDLEDSFGDWEDAVDAEDLALLEHLALVPILHRLCGKNLHGSNLICSVHPVNMHLSLEPSHTHNYILIDTKY